jgi:aromatic ring-opening dioxygenase LigB subunit
MIVFSAIVPHPPESIPGIGNADDFRVISKTLAAYEVLRKELERSNPDTIIVISPHAYMEQYGFIINSMPELRGDFSNFGLEEMQFHFKNDLNLVRKMRYFFKVNEFPAFRHPSLLDHGALIPLYHLTKNIKPKIVHLSFSLMSYQQHYRYGEMIQKIIENGDSGRVAVIASGDLSHKLSKNSPAGFSPSAHEFDYSVLRFLNGNDVVSLMDLEQDVVREAGECGLRSIMILLGILHEKGYSFKMLSYEAPFGIGYLVGSFS